MEEKEIIPLVYAFIHGMRAYRKACDEVEEYFNSTKEIEPELEDIIRNYKRFEKFFSLIEKLME